MKRNSLRCGFCPLTPSRGQRPRLVQGTENSSTVPSTRVLCSLPVLQQTHHLIFMKNFQHFPTHFPLILASQRPCRSYHSPSDRNVCDLPKIIPPACDRWKKGASLLSSTPRFFLLNQGGCMSSCPH